MSSVKRFQFPSADMTTTRKLRNLNDEFCDAVWENDTVSARRLLERGADVNTRFRGRTRLSRGSICNEEEYQPEVCESGVLHCVGTCFRGGRTGTLDPPLYFWIFCYRGVN